MTNLAPLRDRAERLSRHLLGCDAAFAAYLLVLQLWLGLLWLFYQGFGIVRGVILCGFAAALLLLRAGIGRPVRRAPAGGRELTPVLRGLLLVVVLFDLGIVVLSSQRSFETSIIPMDEGQTSWRAARLLWDGEDPYAEGALIDFGAFHSRAALRSRNGIASRLSGASETKVLRSYDKTLSPGLQTSLLPESPSGSPAAAHERRLYGYKYGPVILLATSLLVPTGIAGTVLLLNGLVCFAMFATDWFILRRIAGPQLALAGAAMVALLLDRHITRNFMDRSATDVWALLFGSIAVLAFLARRPLTTAAAVALAIGCKSMPGLMFVPLLFHFRSLRPVLACAVMLALMFLPWLLWDAGGFVDNVFLWSLYMAPDFTSWQFFAPPWASLAARAVAALLLTALWWRFLSGRDARLFWTLAMSGTLVLLASGFLRNGYVPWVSIWAVMAVVEAFAEFPERNFRRAAAPSVVAAAAETAQ